VNATLAKVRLIKAEGGRRGGAFGVRTPDVERDVERLILRYIREDVEPVRR
jgi:hypothetical protein